MDAIRNARFVFALLACFGFSTLIAEGQMPYPMQMQRPAPFPMNVGPNQPHPRTSVRPEVRSENFIVIAATRELADEVARTAEHQRHELAIQWLGRPLPRWPQPCPITVMAGPQIGAGGSTTFTMSRGSVGDWRMNVQGSQERILDSVLPHEVTHTVLATHFAPLGRPVPRWADEGACTTVEHTSEKSKHDHFLVEFLSQGRGIPFATMFSLKEYPADIMPLYAQGYSVSSFLIAQGGPRRFVQFLEDGMRTEDWVTATEKHYGYPKIGKLQNAWNQWVADGGGPVAKHTAVALGMSRQEIASSTPAILVSGSTRPHHDNPSNISSSSISADSWYKRQLNENSETSQPASVATSTSPATTPPSSNPDYSVSHQQGVQGPVGGPVGKWADGPSVPLRR
jgi:hypothetical protein